MIKIPLLDTNVCSYVQETQIRTFIVIISSNSKLRTTQLFNSCRIDKSVVVQTISAFPSQNESYSRHMQQYGESCVYSVKWKRQDIKEFILYDSNIRISKADQTECLRIYAQVIKLFSGLQEHVTVRRGHRENFQDANKFCLLTYVPITLVFVL